MTGGREYKQCASAHAFSHRVHSLGRWCAAVLFIGAFCLVGFASDETNASIVGITFSVVDIEFDGTDIVDIKDPAFGSGDLDEADDLDTMVFQVDGTTVGTLTDPPEDLGVDIYIPSVSAIADDGSVPGISAAGGTLDLITSTDVPGYGLELLLGPVTVSYIPVLGGFTVDFVFAGTVASVGDQDLPFELAIGDPINVTLSTQGTSVISAGGFLTSFIAEGSGEITGELVPESSTMLLGGLAMLLIGLGQARRNRA